MAKAKKWSKSILHLLFVLPELGSKADGRPGGTDGRFPICHKGSIHICTLDNAVQKCSIHEEGQVEMEKCMEETL